MGAPSRQTGYEHVLRKAGFDALLEKIQNEIEIVIDTAFVVLDKYEFLSQSEKEHRGEIVRFLSEEVVDKLRSYTQ